MSIRMLITTMVGSALLLAQATDAGKSIVMDCTVQGRPTSCTVRKAPCKNAAAVGKIFTGDTGVTFTTHATTGSHVPGISAGDDRYMEVDADGFPTVPCTDNAPDLEWAYIGFNGGKYGFVDATCVDCAY